MFTYILYGLAIAGLAAELPAVTSTGMSAATWNDRDQKEDA